MHNNNTAEPFNEPITKVSRAIVTQEVSQAAGSRISVCRFESARVLVYSREV